MEFSKDEVKVLNEALGHFIDRLDGVFGYDADVAKARELRQRIEEENR